MTPLEKTRRLSDLPVLGIGITDASEFIVVGTTFVPVEDDPFESVEDAFI